jgi:TolB protein
VAIDPESGACERIRGLKGQASLSPDGAKAIVGRQLIDLTSNASPRVFDPPDRGDLFWSSDGKRLIIFHGKSPAEPYHKTWQTNSDGSEPKTLSIPDTDSVGDWSSDGQWLVTMSDRHPPHDSGSQLYLMRLDGTAARRITDGRGHNVLPRFSPDGKWVAYHRQENGQLPRVEIVGVDGMNARPLIVEEERKFPEWHSWSRDGKRLVVATLILSDVKSGLVVVDADGKNARPLPLPETGFLGRPMWL